MKPTKENVASLPTVKESNVRTILVIDDDMSTTDSLVSLLHVLGWNAYGSYSAKEAIEFLDNKKVDLIMLDIDMPEVTGYDLVRFLKSSERWKNVPVIAVTGYGMEKDKIKAIQAGFSTHITKPISSRDLREILTSDITA